LNTYTRKEERFKNQPRKTREKKEQLKSKVSSRNEIIRITSEINEIGLSKVADDCNPSCSGSGG
jgi:hypothetical protein